MLLKIKYKSNILERVCTNYSIDLVHPYRLIFEQNKTDVQAVRIINIEDYH